MRKLESCAAFAQLLTLERTRVCAEVLLVIGVPKERKVREYRVGIVPDGAQSLVRAGHRVLIERGAGDGSGISDAEFERTGATLASAIEVWKGSEMIIKVKEPVEAEYELLQKGQILYAYLHLAAVPDLVKVLLQKRVSAVAYETLQLPDGSLPLLRPMSEVAGKMAIQVGAACLERERGGKGLLLGGVPGVRRGRVVVLGGGVVGTNAAKVALGMGSEVVVLDINPAQLSHLDDLFGGRVSTLASNPANIERAVREADLLIGAVLIPGGRAPTLVPESLIAQMGSGSVVVDVAVDQGGCIQTCRPTTHDHPTFTVHGVVHYCVANMPGAVPQTSTYALFNATSRYAHRIAEQGIRAAVERDPILATALNTYDGRVTCQPVAAELGHPYCPPRDAVRTEISS